MRLFLPVHSTEGKSEKTRVAWTYYTWPEDKDFDPLNTTQCNTLVPIQRKFTKFNYQYQKHNSVSGLSQTLNPETLNRWKPKQLNPQTILSEHGGNETGATTEY